MRMRDMIDWRTGENYTCEHEGYHCSRISYPWRYAITRAVPHPTDDVMVPVFIRWSNDDDPEFPCVCDCDDCNDWRELKASIDGPVVLPTE
jgi:hypothetical protein